MTDNTHGGKRPGAGRPLGHGEPTTSIQVRVPNSMLAALLRAARRRGVSRNQIIIEVLQTSEFGEIEIKIEFADENDYADEDTIKEVYPWATEIVDADGGWMVFESAADAETWKNQQ